MSGTLQSLQTQVTQNTSVIQSAVTLINGFADQLRAAGTDPVALQALQDSLTTSDQALAAAVAANTPAANTTAASISGAGAASVSGSDTASGSTGGATQGPVSGATVSGA